MKSIILSLLTLTLSSSLVLSSTTYATARPTLSGEINLPGKKPSLAMKKMLLMKQIREVGRQIRSTSELIIPLEKKLTALKKAGTGKPDILEAMQKKIDALKAQKKLLESTLASLLKQLAEL